MSGTNATSEPVDLSKKAVLVYDHGTFVEMAFRLAREGGFGKVYYCTPWEEAFSRVEKAVIGDGFEEIIRVKEPWKLIDNAIVDMVVFPDVHHAELQEHIEALGFPVWGARSADELELHKLKFKKLQDELGMNHAEYDVVEGLDALREYCQKNKDRYIKLTPQFRGNRETFHHQTYEESRQKLAEMDLEFGPLGSVLKFLCEHPLKGELEGGIDTYTVDGKCPETVISGWEIKDKCYFAEVVKWNELPTELVDALTPLLPILKERHCRQMLSTEVKIEEKVLLEPTIRLPSPAGEEQMELYENFPQIIWHGAHGKLIEPEVIAKYACEAMVSHNDKEQYCRGLKIPNSVRQWVKLYNICQAGDYVVTSPGDKIIGAVVGIGDTPDEALEHLKENAAAMEDQPVTVHVEELAKAFKELETAQEEGVGFKNAEVPEPSDALS